MAPPDTTDNPQQPDEAEPADIDGTVEPPPLGDNPPHENVTIAGIELPPQFDFLRNRLLLAGFAVLAVLLVTAIVLVVLSGNTDDDDASASADTTPDGAAVATPDADFTARVLTTATLRAGPGLDYLIMGTVPEGAVVVVSGRNEDNGWLQIIYPPGSQLRGWVPADQLDLTGDVALLPIEGPAEAPEVPTDLPIYDAWTSTPAPYVPPENTPPPPATNTPLLPTNTPILPTSTPALPTNTPPGQGGAAAVQR